MDPREQLKLMLQDIINDRQEQADMTLHNYLVAKTQEVSGLGATPSSSIKDEWSSMLDTE